MSHPRNKIPCLPFSVHTGQRKPELRQHLYYKKPFQNGIWKQKNKEPKITQVQFILLQPVTQLKQEMVTLDRGTSPPQDESWIVFGSAMNHGHKYIRL